MHDFFEAYVSAFEKNTNILSHKTFVALACEGGKGNSDDEEDESDTANEMETTQVEEIENEEDNNDGEDVLEGGGNEDQQDGYVFDEFEDSQDFFNLNRNRNF